jgi:hypothetical protein
MTPEQYDHWKDFARRMAHIVRGPRHKSPSRADVREHIDFFFECCMDPGEEWERVRDWDHTEPTKDEKSRWPWSATCVSDHIKEHHEVFIPDYWSLDRGDDEAKIEARIERARSRFVDPISCCIRAGLDVAVSPSAGVCGYTAGDIRKMYPEGVPEWVKAFFDGTDETVAMHPTNIEGIYIPEVTKVAPVKFDEIPDGEHVWL